MIPSCGCIRDRTFRCFVDRCHTRAAYEENNQKPVVERKYDSRWGSVEYSIPRWVYTRYVHKVTNFCLCSQADLSNSVQKHHGQSIDKWVCFANISLLAGRVNIFWGHLHVNWPRKLMNVIQHKLNCKLYKLKLNAEPKPGACISSIQQSPNYLPTKYIAIILGSLVC